VSVASNDHEVRVEQPGLLRQHRENAVGQLNHPRLVGLRPSRNRRAHRLLVFDAGSRVLGVVDRGWRKRERVIAFADIHALAVEQREPRGESRRVRASPSDRDERGVAPRGAPLLRNVRIRVHFRRYSA
jgi:hypothetical protein